MEESWTMWQAHSQDFGGEGRLDSESQHQKGFGGVTPGKIVKNVPLLWCIIILNLLHSELQRITFFLFLFPKNISNCIKTTENKNSLVFVVE